MTRIKHIVVLGLIVSGVFGSVAAHASSNGCQQAEDREATSNCLVKQLRDSDEALNAAYRTLLGQVDEQAKSVLRQQQRDWLQKRARACELQGAPSEREPWLEWLERRPDRMICATHQAQQRTVELQASVLRPNASSSAGPGQSAASGLTIQSAVYASPHGQSFDVTGQLRSTCAAASGSCLISCGNQLAGDPDFGTPKICRIAYACSGQPATAIQMREGERLSLACSPSTPGQGRQSPLTPGAGPGGTRQNTAPSRATGSVAQSLTSTQPPLRASARLQAIATVAERWAIMGNFTRAATLLEPFAEARDTTASDRFLADAYLQRYYTRLDDRAALLRVDRARLTSAYFGADARSPQSALIQRAGLMLQVARDQLALLQFDEAGQTAAAVLQLLGNTGLMGTPAQEHADASQIAQLAQSHQSVVSPPEPLIDRAAAAVDAAQPAFSTAEAANACASVLEHANSDTLKALSIPWSDSLNTSAGSTRSAGDQQGAIDLFGDGMSVLVAIDNGELNIRHSDGSRLDVRQSPDQNWDEGEGSDPTLLRVGMHYYVLAADGMQLLHLSEFSRNHVERKACEFVPLPAPPSDDQASAARPHYELRTALEQLIADANSLEAYTLTRYVMLEPGVDAARAVLEASRRKDNPIPLVPQPSYRDPAGESILVSAVKARRYDVLQFLLDHGVDPNLADHGLRFNRAVLPDTPLAIAVKNDDEEAARILLTHGAHPDSGGEFPGANLLTQSYASDPVAMFGLFLDEGANPNSVSPPGAVQDVLQRSARVPDMPTRIDLLLRHGADPDQWVTALFNAIAMRSGLANANVRLERQGGTLAESALYTPVQPDWVNELLASPVRAPDIGLEPLLREAAAIRAAAPCSKGTRAIPTEHLCQLPRSVRAAVAIPASGGTGQTSTTVAASPIPLNDRTTFVTYAAAQLQQQLPGFTVSPDKGTSSMLIVDPRGAKVGHLNIRQTYEWCRGRVSGCDSTLSRWLQAAQTAVQNQQRTPDPKELIIFLGPRDMFEKLAAPRAPSTPALAMRPCVADLVCVLGIKDFSTSRLLDEDDLRHMHLTLDQGIQLAQKNTKSRLEAVSALEPLSASQSIAFNDDTELEGSRLALPSEWQSIAAGVGGDLIAAIPAADIVVYARGDRPHAVEELRKFVQAVYPTAVQPDSTEIFRWAPTGWTAVP